MRLRINLKKIIAACVVALAAVGCATVPQTPEELVAQRAQARLDALMAWDLDKALSYSTPSYREVFGKGHLASAYAGVRNWTSAEVDQVACEEQRCRVRYMVEYEITRPRYENRRPLVETWVLLDGDWFWARQ